MLVAAALVLVTWSLTMLAILALGLAPALATCTGPVTFTTLRRAMWWGLSLLAVLAVALSLAVPLRSGPAAGITVLAALVLGASGLIVGRRRGWEVRCSWTKGGVVVAGALAAAGAFLAFAATGPVTNYDSGLYHLGAIQYGADSAAVPGLANLYGPLAYATAEFPLAALLGNGPLGANGFRALNGLVLVLACVDLVLRFTRRHRRAGDFVLAVGLTATLVPMVALADYWVTSPTQDSAVLMLTVVASAYLADAVSRGSVSADGAIVIATCVGLVLLRPTMVAFAGACLLVLVVLASRRRSPRRPGAALATMSLVVAAAVAVAARDRVLSGWLQYPLSVFAFDVPWRAADPTPLREATLGFARDPADTWGSIDGFGWAGAWLQRLPSQWETYLLALLIVVATVCVVVAARTTDFRWRGLLVCMVPSLLATAVWWAATPPSFRFIWGPLFTIGTIPIGWALWRLNATGRRWAMRLTVVGVAAPVLAVTVVTILARQEWTTPRVTESWGPFSYTMAALPSPAVDRQEMSSGLTVLYPVESDQCWGVFPLCTPDPAPGLRLRGDGWQDGFLP